MQPTLFNTTQPATHISSLQLVEIINEFRTNENRSKLRHSEFLRTIRDEFEQELRKRKIASTLQTVAMPKGGSKKTLVYMLTYSQAKQLLVRESKQIRRAVIAHIENLEAQLQKPQLHKNRHFYGRIGALTAQVNRQKKELAKLQELQLIIKNHKPNKNHNKEPVLPYKLFGHNTLLDFVWSVQVLQQDLEVALRALNDRYKTTNHFLKRFTELYPQANPKGQSRSFENPFELPPHLKRKETKHWMKEG